jgi:signal transduction histidine kinase
MSKRTTSRKAGKERSPRPPWLERWAPRLPAVERPMLLLRWLALLLVLVLQWFDRSTAGVFFPVPYMALVVGGYNGLLLLLMRYARWAQRPLNYLALDTLVATLAVYLTGGYHSSFFVLYVFITIGAAFHLELVPTVIATLGIGLIYIGACYVNPVGLQSPYAQYILAAKLLLLLVVAVLCAFLLEQLRREHLETEQERALAQRLRVLNELFQQLSTSLDLDRTMQTVAEAPRALLDADLTSIALLDETGRWPDGSLPGGKRLSVAAAAGMDAEHLVGVQWPADDTLVSAVLSAGRPYVVSAPQRDELSGSSAVMGDTRAVVPVASAVFVPLLLDDMPMGMLNVGYRQQRDLTQEDLAFLHALGQEAGLAIRNARLYERERDQVTRLRNLDELQQAFVSSVSHELRTPLTCIRTSVDLLCATIAQGCDFTEEQRDLVHTIEHHVGRLEALVTDLLEITKLEAGQVTLSKQPTDLRRIADRVVEALHPLTDHKEQNVHLHWPESLSRVEVDRQRIEQVLTNILSNAIKFTPKRGQIDVYVSETPDDLQVCVCDNGPGIPEREQPRLFDRFYVVTDGRGLSGVGLGLYIARQMIELHGGRIWVESQVGKGSTFCFAVPKTTAAAREGQE